MTDLIEFLLNNYIWLIVVILILIFALIGYLVDIKNKESNNNKVKPIANFKEDVKFEVHPSMTKYTSDDFDDPLIK